MKKYSSTNFFKHTFCEFTQVDDFIFPENSNYKSKSESQYFYTDEGVYRKSNHWGRVANCRWKLISNKNYKNQQEVIAFAKWVDFYPINSLEKLFFIEIDFDKRITKIKVKKGKTTKKLYFFSEAQKKTKLIQHLFKDNKWAKYYDEENDVLEKKVILKLINSDKSLLEIKSELK